MEGYIKKVFITIGIVISILLLPILFYFVFPHFIPFIIALLLAIMLEPLNEWLIRNTKIKRKLAVHLTYFLFLGSIALIFYFTVTKIIIELVNFTTFVQKNISFIQKWFYELYLKIQNIIQMLPPETSARINQSFMKFVDQLANLNLLSTIWSGIYGITTAIPNLFFIVLIILISLYFFTLHLPGLKNQFYQYFKDSSRQKVQVVLNDIRNATIGFLQGQLILSTITFLVSSIGLFILGVNYALIIAFFIVIVDVLPILGTGSVLVPWAIYALTQGNTYLAIGLIVLFLVMTIVRRIVEPKILGEQIGLSALSTLISIWVGFKVLGVLGVFLGPLIIILYKAFVKAEIIPRQMKI
ncbi:sporulation integral membrane protein YtvI [Tepidibacillus fermentans]|uniref:Sporulation integral membrane protein YtvI n=1 Tax=Tepidibacillus fermentans TaxID=1281767 RepID=A0A4R3KBM8_9BACI|nr:sporulation integral membrane protein YtvI [Tepidibacillus fermentans]TCS80594.1 sporulation integral membrane protein YtvI [Tepidibacillus fermentans]